MADRFYVNSPLAPATMVQLDGPEAHHLTVVCRARPGDAICLFNGDGREYPATVREVGRRSVTVEVVAVEAPQRELPFRLVVAAPVPKGDRAVFLVEKLTELGTNTFVPLSTARSVVHPKEAKFDKLRRHVIEASKQCGRNVLMEVTPLRDWPALCQDTTLPPHKLIAHPDAPALALAPMRADIAIAVGPEGGLTDEEVALAVGAGWQAMSLGPRILRVETAALALAVLVSAP
jgi:16S rRNA (uracil1498-N3)-methyltransferase